MEFVPEPNDFPWRVDITTIHSEETGIPTTAFAMDIAESLALGEDA